MFFPYEPDLDAGTTVLVTGVSGFVGSHIADQLLSGGYNVRGITRDAAKTSWIASLFEKKHGPNRFQLYTVPNIVEANAFAVVLKGAFWKYFVPYSAHDLQQEFRALFMPHRT